MSRAEEILSFWFGEPGTIEYGKQRQIWFQKKLNLIIHYGASFYQITNEPLMVS